MTIRRLEAVRPEEARGVVWSFFYFFFLLSSYYLLRPLREARGVGVGVENLPYLYTVTLLVVSLVAPLWAALVSRISRRRLLPLAYRFFALNMIGFYLLSLAYPEHWLISAAFYVWLSVFNLMAVAVFWSFMSDVWRTDQGRRLFGLITVGGSIGAVLGPALTALLVTSMRPEYLLLLGALLLEAATFCLGRVGAWQRRTPSATPVVEASRNPEDPVGGGVLSGLKPVVQSPYLAGAAVYVLASTLSGTFNFYLQAHLAAATGGDQVALTQLFAWIDLATNILTAGLQGFVAGRLLTRWGVTPALAVLPLVLGIGFGAAALVPALALVATLSVLRRATAYGLSNPAYGVLFTVVSREEKYKARPFIDLVVYRTGDVAGGWLFTILLRIGAGLSGAAVAGALIAIPWLFLARFLGRQHRRLVA